MQKTPDIELECGLCERGLADVAQLVELKNMGHLCFDCIQNLADLTLPAVRNCTPIGALVGANRAAGDGQTTAAIIDLGRYKAQARMVISVRVSG